MLLADCVAQRRTAVADAGSCGISVPKDCNFTVRPLWGTVSFALYFLFYCYFIICSAVDYLFCCLLANCSAVYHILFIIYSLMCVDGHLKASLRRARRHDRWKAGTAATAALGRQDRPYTRRLLGSVPPPLFARDMHPPFLILNCLFGVAVDSHTHAGTDQRGQVSWAGSKPPI